MKNIRFFFFALADPQPLETRISERCVVIAGVEAGQRGDGINSDAEKIMGKSLEKRQRIRGQLANLREKIRVTDFRELGQLLLL